MTRDTQPCPQSLFFGEDRSGEGIDFDCQRPAGHDAPHRWQSPADDLADAERYEWWPETWWADAEPPVDKSDRGPDPRTFLGIPIEQLPEWRRDCEHVTCAGLGICQWYARPQLIARVRQLQEGGDSD